MNYWWVNQSWTYELERSQKKLCAPSTCVSRSNRTELVRPHWSWKTLTETSPKDVVFHFVTKDQAIKAVGLVTEQARLEPIESDRGFLMVAGREQWRVGVRSFNLEKPIDRAELPAALATLPGGPYDKRGRFKEAYLMPLSVDFARELIRSFPARWPAEPLQT